MLSDALTIAIAVAAQLLELYEKSRRAAPGNADPAALRARRV